MNGHHFDTLIKNVAATRSRRQLVQGLAATAASSLALRFSVVSTVGQVVSEDSGETCSQDSDCIPAEHDPCTGAVCDAGSCSYTSVACMPGYICCRNGECCLEGEADTSSDGTITDAAGSGESDEEQSETPETGDHHCAASPS